MQSVADIFMQKEMIYRNNSDSSVSVDADSGSFFWSVAGKSLQFTWFDVPAQTEFPVHSHASEQVTYVLEGELFFESGKTIHKLSKGDCILIPGNINHRVWTEKIPAIAVDAWAPVNENYLIKKYSHEK